MLLYARLLARNITAFDGALFGVLGCVSLRNVKGTLGYWIRKAREVIRVVLRIPLQE